MSAFTDQAKGRLKKAAGALTGNRSLQRDGSRDERAGRAKHQADQAIDAVKNTIEHARPSTKKED